MENKDNNDYITEQEAKAFRKLFVQYLKSYQKKETSMTDNEWLEHLFLTELPEISKEEANQLSTEIMNTITTYDHNLNSINSATQKGISKERWLSDKIEEAFVGVSINEYGKKLQQMDDYLYIKNLELDEALRRSTDGCIKMSPNLDGNIAENMIAKTTELSGFLQEKNIKVEVRDAFTKNSVDVRAINLDTGKYQNYQLKFGKDSKSTIDLIERGNYSNQQIIVPSEQLEDIQAYFKAKGSSKTISDHIEIGDVKGKSFTKQDMKEFQITAQKDDIMPSMDYNYYQTRDLAMSIGKNAGISGLQTAAITTGWYVANKIFHNEKIEGDKIVEVAIKTGADTSIKVITAGTLQVATRKGIINCVKSNNPSIITNLACVGIENVKILSKIASNELSMIKGLDQMGQVTISMISGLLGAAILAPIPILMPIPSGIVGFISGMIGYSCGAKFGDTIYNTAKKVGKTAKKVGESTVNFLKNRGHSILNKIKSFLTVSN